MTIESIKLQVIPNNCLFRVPCPLCGTWDRPDVPWWISLDGGRRSSVCSMCAKEHDPMLLRVVQDANSAHYLVRKYSSG